MLKERELKDDHDNDNYDDINDINNDSVEFSFSLTSIALEYFV